MREKRTDPEFLAQERERARIREKSPEVRERKYAWKRERMKDPEYRKRYNEVSNKRQQTPEYRDKRYRRQFGVSLDWVERTLAAQGGRCAICETADSGAYFWHVDHDHKCCPGNRSCGKCVRGLLCGGCNKGILGGSQDRIDVLERAIHYLKIHSTSSDPLPVAWTAEDFHIVWEQLPERYRLRAVS